MRIFDPHAHMTSRTTDDYEAMAASGVKALVEPAFWLGQPRTSVGSFVDYFNSLLGWERFRAAQFGIRHHCTIGLNPKEANDDALRREVLDVLPRFLAKDGVVAVGEIGFDAMTPAEEEALRAQLALAREHELPVLVHTPHRDKARRHAQDARARREPRASPPEMVADRPQQRAHRRGGARLRLLGGLLDLPGHEDGRAPDGARSSQEHGPERIIVNSACDWGVSDPLKVAQDRRRDAARRASTRTTIDRVVWRNPVEFFAPERPADPRRPRRAAT